MNPVATISFGPAQKLISSRVRSLTDITPAIVELLSDCSEPA
jgi:hypothetical protein